MGKTIKQTRHKQRFIILFLFITIIIHASTSFAQDIENITRQGLVVSTNILLVAANMNSEQMSISYNGLSIGKGLIFKFDKNVYGPDDSKLLKPSSEDLNKDGYLKKLDRKIKEMSHYLLRFFNVDDFSKNDEDSKFAFTSTISAYKINPNDFEFKLSLNIGYDDEDAILKMNAVKVESFWLNTYVNAVYNYGKSEFELGLSNSHINKYLLDGMRLEFQANPTVGSGAILLTMSL